MGLCGGFTCILTIIQGFEAPDQKEPRVPIDPTKAMEDGDNRKRNKDNKESDKKTRDKANPNPKDNVKNK